MPIELDEVFRELTPPPGGPEKLRARLAAAPRPRRWLPWFAFAAPAAVAAALVVMVALPPRTTTAVEVTIGTALNPAVMRYLRPAPDNDRDSAVSVPAGQQRGEAVRRVDPPADDVLFFWVATIGDGTADPTDRAR